MPASSANANVNLNITEKGIHNIKDAEVAVAKLTASLSKLGKESVESAGRQFGGMDKVKTSISGYTDAQGKLQYAVRASGKAIDTATRAQNEHNKALGHGQKSWAAYAEGVFLGVGVYTLVSAGLRQLRGAMSAVGDAAIGLNAKLEQARIGFGTLLGSAEAAQTHLEGLYQFALKTPFQFPELIDASKKMLAFGFSAQEITPMLTAIGNAAAALGSGSVGIDRITLALGQMGAKGKVQGQELRQLGEAGIKIGDIMAIIATKHNKSVEEIMRMQEAGALKATEFIEAFKEYSKLKFGDMMEKQTHTFLGAMSNIKDAGQMIIAKGFEDVFKKMTDAAQKAANYLMSPAGQAWVGSIKRGLEDLSAVVVKVIPLLLGLANVVKDNINVALSLLALKVTADVVPSILALVSAITKVNPVLALMALGIMYVVASSEKMTKKLDEIDAQSNKQIKSGERQAQAMGELGEEYAKVTKRLAELERIRAQAELAARSGMGAGEGEGAGLGYAKLLENTDDEIAALIKRKKELDQAFIAGQTVSRDFIDMISHIPDAVSSAATSLTSKLNPAIMLTRDEASEFKEKLEQAFVSLGSGFSTTAAGSLAWADKVRTSLGLPTMSIKIMEEQINLAAETLKKLSPEEAMGYWDELSNIFYLFTRGITSADTAGAMLKSTLDKIDLAAQKAADVKRWQDMAKEMVSGLAGVFEEVNKIGTAQPKVIPEYDIEQNIAKLEKLKAELPQIEENIRRIQGVSSATDLNWKYPDPNQIAELESKVRANKAAQAELNAEIGKMRQTNADAVSSENSKYSNMLKALGEYYAKFVWTQEQMGKITSAQADAMLKSVRTMFGAELDDFQKIQREMEKIAPTLGKAGTVGQAVGMAITKSLIGIKDPASQVAIELAKWNPILKLAEINMNNLDDAGQAALIDLIAGFNDAKMPIEEMTRKAQEFFDKLTSESGEGKARDKLFRMLGEPL